jgi:hypothetical protein
VPKPKIASIAQCAANAARAMIVIDCQLLSLRVAADNAFLYLPRLTRLFNIQNAFWESCGFSVL